MLAKFHWHSPERTIIFLMALWTYQTGWGWWRGRVAGVGMKQAEKGLRIGVAADNETWLLCTERQVQSWTQMENTNNLLRNDPSFEVPVILLQD